MFEKAKEYLKTNDFESQPDQLFCDEVEYTTFVKQTTFTTEEVVAAFDGVEIDFNYEGLIVLDDGQQIGFEIVKGVTSLDDLKRHMTAFRNLVKFYTQK